MYPKESKKNMFSFLDIKIKELKKCGISNAKKEIEWLLQKHFSISQETLIFKQNFLLTPKQLDSLNQSIVRRKKKEPFQYIINSAPFYGYDIFVNQNVLIPRPETEVIIDVLKKKKTIFNNALDIGTGSGNLALVLSLEKIAHNITASDISKKALQVAKINFSNYNIKNINILQNNFLNKKITEKFDLVVCNPPYISLSDFNNLSETVKNFEPKIALTDQNKGTIFYKKLSKSIHGLLNKNGIMLLETGGTNTHKEIQTLFNNHQTTWHKDLQNQKRILEIKK